MRTRPPRLLVVPSLLLFVAIGCLCARSFLVADGLSVGTATEADGALLLRARLVFSDYGGITLGQSTVYTTDPRTIAGLHRPLPVGRVWDFGTSPAGEMWGRAPTLRNVLSFDTEWYRIPVTGGTRTMRAVRVPYWAPALAAILPPVLWTVRRRYRLRVRRRRSARGQCPGCGYDVRASPGKCPECGDTADAAVTASGRSDSSPGIAG